MHDITADGERASGAGSVEAPGWLSTLSGRLLLALVAFVFVATAGVLAVELARGRRQLLAQEQAALSGRARLVSDRLGRSVRERQRLVSVWPQLESSQDLAVDDVDKRLALSLTQLAANLGQATLAFGLDPAGRVVAASEPRWLGRSLPGPAWRPGPGVATRLLAPPADMAAGVPQLAGAADSLPDERLLVVVAPVRDRASGRPLGAIALATPWQALVAGAAAGVGDVVRVSDEGGATSVVPPGTPPGDRLWGRPVAVALAGPRVQVRNALPRDRALAPLRETERRLLLLALVVLAITAPAAALVAAGTTRALARLTGAALAVQRAGTPPAGLAFEAVPAGAPREVHVLAGALAEMVRRLEQSRHELARQESLASLGSMAAVLAHEIRTPLAVLRGSADLLARKLVGDDKGMELVQLLRDETERLGRLASDLLLFARPRPPERAPIDLEAVAARAADLLAARFREAGVTLESATSPAPVQADPEQLGQAVLNVLGNALDVSPGGSVVRLETGTAPGSAFVRVSDQGPGIEADNLERIWLPFFTTRRGGTGLGLSIVRQVLDAHGGRATIDTSAAGTRITLTLPREELA